MTTGNTVCSISSLRTLTRPRKPKPRFSHPHQIHAEQSRFSISLFLSNAPNRQCNSTSVKSFDGAFCPYHLLFLSSVVEDLRYRGAESKQFCSGSIKNWPCMALKAKFGCMGGVRGIGQTDVTTRDLLGKGEGNGESKRLHGSACLEDFRFVLQERFLQDCSPDLG